MGGTWITTRGCAREIIGPKSKQIKNLLAVHPVRTLIIFVARATPPRIYRVCLIILCIYHVC